MSEIIDSVRRLKESIDKLKRNLIIAVFVMMFGLGFLAGFLVGLYV